MATTSVLNSDWSTKFTLPPQPTGKPEEDVAALSETLKSHILMIREMARELNTGAIIQLGDAATSVGATSGALRYVTRPQWHDGTDWREFSGGEATDATGDYTVLAADEIIECDSASAITITLLSLSDATHIITIKNLGAGVVTVAAAGTETIDDETTQSLEQYDSIDIYPRSDGWRIK